MMNQERLAKYTGSLLLLQLVGGIFLNFFLLQKLKFNLDLAEPSSITLVIGVATILALILSSINLIIAAIAKHILSKHSPIHTQLLVAVSVVAFTLTATEYATLGEYVNFFIHMVEQGTQTLSAYEELMKFSLIRARDEIHYMTIAISSVSILLFYSLLFRVCQIPKMLTGFAIFAGILQLVALSNTFFQGKVLMMIQLPLLITQILLPMYLFVNGFRVPDTNEED